MEKKIILGRNNIDSFTIEIPIILIPFPSAKVKKKSYVKPYIINVPYLILIFTQLYLF